MTDQHPLTNEVIWATWSASDHDAFGKEKLARAAADWQLEQVIKWLRTCKDCYSPLEMADLLEEELLDRFLQEDSND